MIRRLLLLATLLCAPLCVPALANAQQAVTVTTCGALGYTAGYQRPQTMDTGGNLCTSAGSSTGSGVVGQASTTSGQTGILTQGAVTTSAPSYTTAQTNPLSLTTAGGLRTADVTSVTQGSTTSGQSGQLIQGSVTTAAPSYTTAQTSPLSLTTAGALRTDHSTTAGTATSVNAGLNDTGTQRVAVALPAIPITGASANTPNAVATAQLFGTSGVTTYITGFQCTASGATAALVVSPTVAGVVTGTMTYTFVFPAGATVQATPLIVTFPTPVPASATNTDITVSMPASGAGGTNAACNVQGFRQ